MGCPKNPKKFLGFIPYEGEHDFELESMTHFAYFTLEFECKACGARRIQQLLDEEMVREGYDLRKLRQRQGDAMHLVLSAEELEKFREDPQPNTPAN